MASFFTIGENKTRPGLYYRYENWGTPPTAGADDGKCACVLRSNWGPIGTAVLLESYDTISDYYGTGDDNSTLAVPLEQFKGGAKSVRAVRVGTGGSCGGYTLLDEDGTEVLKLTLKYVGSRELSVTLRPTVDDDQVYELLILEGTTQLEQILFQNPEGDKTSWDLLEQAGSSNYFTLSSLAVTQSTLATIDQEAIVGGTDPLITSASYSDAFEVLEASRWNAIAIDTEDLTIQMMLQLFLNRIYQDGLFCVGVVGCSTSVDFDTRLVRASSFNDYQMVYVGSGFVDGADCVYEGYLAAARISGMVAGTPSNQSITHVVLTGGVDLTEHLTNNQHERAIQAGMVTFSVNPANTIWIESGINTLVVLDTTQDEGWKKIKRTKVRFELFQRLADTVEGLVGRVNNNEDGRMTIIQSCNNVCNIMVAEQKLHTGAYVTVDPDRSPAGDSAWFVVYADDVDALEKLYCNFKFRFAVED